MGTRDGRRRTVVLDVGTGRLEERKARRKMLRWLYINQAYVDRVSLLSRKHSTPRAAIV